MKLIWHSNAAFAPSGYGVQTRINAKRIQKMPEVEQLLISAYYGIHGGIVEWEGLIHLPPRDTNWGNNCLQLHTYHTNSDVVISLMDIWVLKPDLGQQGFLWAPWFPIDHDIVPPSVMDRAQRAYMPITMAKFGYQLCQEARLKNVRYVPHSVETNIYKPQTRDTRKAMRDKLGIPQDVFLVGIVAANKGWPSRKALPQMIRALSTFMKKHKDVYVYLHTMVTAEDQGADIPTIIRHYGEADKYVLPNPYLYVQGYPDREMAKIYSTFDLFMLTSMGEGFGIPIIEAQSCGVPAMVTDFSSMPELIAPGGHKISYSDKWYTPMDAHQVIPNTDEIIETLEIQYKQSKADVRAQRKSARDFIVQNYDADDVVEKYWHPIISELNAITAKRTYRLAS